MTSNDLKRSYTETKESPSQVNGAANGSVITRNQQQQHQQAQSNAEAAKLQQQHRQSLMNGNQHGLAHSPAALKKKYVFHEGTEEILKKYEKLKPSLEFHIHENHYRFGAQVSGDQSINV